MSVSCHFEKLKVSVAVFISALPFRFLWSLNGPSFTRRLKPRYDESNSPKRNPIKKDRFAFKLLFLAGVLSTVHGRR